MLAFEHPAVMILISSRWLLSYAIVKETCVELYVDDSKLNDRIHEELKKNNVNIHPYNDIYEDIKGFG